MNTQITTDINELIKTLPKRVVSIPDEIEPIDTKVSPNIFRFVRFKGTDLDNVPDRLPDAITTIRKQAKTCIMAAMRAEVRADWLQSLNGTNLITSWAAGKADLPQYAGRSRENGLAEQIGEVRLSCC